MTTKVEPGQVWVDTYDYGDGTQYALNPPTFEVEAIEGGRAIGIRRPSGRRSRVKIDPIVGLKGYRLKT